MSSRISRTPGEEKSQSQFCWSISAFPQTLLVVYWFCFLWRSIFSLHNLFSWPVTSESIWFFTLWRGITSCSVVRWNPQPHPNVQKAGCARLPRIYIYTNYTSKFNDTEDFEFSSKWKPERRILNRAVYWLLNQRTQITEIVIHTMNACAFFD